eukprot:CAMPEP_0197023826 /NCGR_PEP_ID=MMETSP1384-20130603/4466_1 /TAXON_ID=29189 /ORGANISM="Ammonia sp." /LENGTH=1061 /DNA_ID=CAMNT_0042452103 /DNA_START=67 /DNA_END=3252 /DNA_ORIENTATION=+
MPKTPSKGKAKGKSKGKSKKKDNKKETEKEAKVDQHPGYGCLYLGDKELQTYGFKTGGGLLDVAAFKTLKKADILEEISFKGKMCAFAAFKEAIEQYQNEDVLFIWDPDEAKQAECNFYFCTNAETFESEKQRLGISDDGLMMDEEEMKRLKLEQEEEERRQQMELERQQEEARIAAAIEELKKPLVARKWTDLGSLDEIMRSKMKANRIATRVLISKKRKYFGQNIQFSDQDNVDGMHVEIKSLQSASTKYGYDVYKKLVDRNYQIGLPMVQKATQTQWNRKMNKIIQYECNLESIKTSSFGVQTAEPSKAPKPKIPVFGLDDEKSEENTAQIAVHNDEEQAMQDADEHELNEKLEQFLEDVCNEFETMLTDNNLVNIFQDDFALFTDRDKELGLDTKTENIKEMQNFVDLNWSRGKKISDIHWMPSNESKPNNIVAVSCIENMSFDERVDIMNKSRISTILLWNLSHILLRAQIILTAPADIFTFKFHPNNSNIVIGGLETGQVALWDLNDCHYQQQQQQQTAQGKQQDADANHDDDEDDADLLNPFRNKQRSIGKKSNTQKTDDDDDDEKIPQIQAKLLSHIEKSHIKCVTDIVWLPQDIMIASNGELQYVDVQSRPQGSKRLSEEQFMSVAGDGSLLFWDIQTPKQTEKEKKKNEAAKWVPVYCKKLDRKYLSENIFVDKAAMDLAKYEANNAHENEQTAQIDCNDDENAEAKNDSSQSVIFGNRLCYTPLTGKVVLGTELGEYCLFNFGKISAEFIEQKQSIVNTNTPPTAVLLKEHENSKQKEHENSNHAQNNNGSNGEKGDDYKLQLQNEILSCHHMYKEHFLDMKSISISPHFCDIYLSIADWRFCIWRNNELIFVSPYSGSYICCGCWSPTRPAVIITAKYDGSVDVWDLLDQTHSPVFKNSPISSVAITSIVFSPFAKNSKNGGQQLAVGDANGNLRILQIPRNFAIPLSNEKLLMAQFYEKEYIRIQFINKRYLMQMQKTIQSEKKEKEKEKDADGQPSGNDQRNASNSNNSEENVVLDEQKEIDTQLENKYQNLLVAFKKQLKIKDDDK